MPEWNAIGPVLLNIVAVSIPEQIFLVLFSLVLMKRFDLITLKKDSIYRLLIAVVPAAVLSNVLRGFAGFDMNLMPFIGLLTVIILMTLAYGIHKPGEVLKLSVSVVISFILVMATQLLYFPFILYGTDITMAELNKPGGLVLILSLIDRTAQFCILAFAIRKKKSFLRINLLKVVFKDRILGTIAAFVTIFDLTFLYVISSSIYADKLLIGLPFYKQLVIITAIVLLPVLNISGLLYVIYHSRDADARKRFSIQEELKVSIRDIEFYLNRGETGKIKKELQYLDNDTNALYKEGE